MAHESSVAVKCMALDPNEEFFVTGSADGDIKVSLRFSSIFFLDETILFENDSL